MYFGVVGGAKHAATERGVKSCSIGSIAYHAGHTWSGKCRLTGPTGKHRREWDKARVMSVVKISYPASAHCRPVKGALKVLDTNEIKMRVTSLLKKILDRVVKYDKNLTNWG